MSAKQLMRRIFISMLLPLSGTLHAEKFADSDDQMCISHRTPLPEHTSNQQSAALSDHHQHHKSVMTTQGYSRDFHQYTIPQVNLVTMQGEETSLSQLLDTDQPIALNFIFTSCTTICPIMSATFSRTQHKMGENAHELRWISVTIDPDYDTPERLRSYAHHFNADAKWQFITGDSTSIITLQKAFDVYRGDKMNHVPVTLLRSSKNAQWLRLEGLLSSNDLIKEYQRLTSPE